MKSVDIVVSQKALAFCHNAFSTKKMTNGDLLCKFKININKCRNPVGKYLADNILSTEQSSSKSFCEIELYETEVGLHLSNIAKMLIAHTSVDDNVWLNDILGRVSEYINLIRDDIENKGNDKMFSNRIVQYNWPIFGNTETHNIYSAEQYFDFCAVDIMTAGGIIRRIGSNQIEACKEIVEIMQTRNLYNPYRGYNINLI